MPTDTTTICELCGRTLALGDWPFCPHGPMTRPFSVIPDDYGRVIVDENMAHTPVTYRTRSERRRLMAQHGVLEQVRHVGLQGSDKNPGKTDRWI